MTAVFSRNLDIFDNFWVQWQFHQALRYRLIDDSIFASGHSVVSVIVQ